MMIAPKVGVSRKCSGLENKPSPWRLGFERPTLGAGAGEGPGPFYLIFLKNR